MPKGAMTIAEGSQKKDYLTDATMVLNGESEERGYVLRTAFDPISVWKAKYAKNISPFYPRLRTGIREAALIDNEIWVFGINGTNAQDLIAAVNVGAEFYRVKPSYLLSKIYIKNLNAEGEVGLPIEQLVRINQTLYRDTVAAIKEAREHFGLTQTIDIHIYSASDNPKIPKAQLYAALLSGGAGQVFTDKRQLVYRSGSNDGLRRARINTNMHIAQII